MAKYKWNNPQWNYDTYLGMTEKPGGLNQASKYAEKFGVEDAYDKTWEDPSQLADYEQEYFLGNKNEKIHKDDWKGYQSAWKNKWKDPAEARLTAELANPNIDPQRKAKILSAYPHLAKKDAPLAEGEAPATEAEAPEATPSIDAWMPPKKSQADIEADMGRHSTGGVDWNVGLGNVGGWDLSTQGSFNRGGEDRHGIKDKDDYNVRLNAARGMDWNEMMGMAPLGGPAAKGRYSDYEGGEYKPREMGSRLSTSEVERGRRPAPMAAPAAAADPLQAYLDAGISRDQAEMLAANKVPPPPARRNMGGPIYANQGRYAIQGVPQLQQQPGVMDLAMDFGKSKALNYGLETMFPGGGIAAEGARAIAPAFGFESGGKVPWWKKAADYAWGTGRKGERARGAMQGKRDPKTGNALGGAIAEGATTALIKGALGLNQGGKVNMQKPAYRQMGGMTPGPLGMTDMIAAGKGKDVSKVKYKKTGGDVTDEMEISYHAPLAPKTGE